MSGYFVTGATGFIGKRLVGRLLERGGEVHALVRPGSEEKLAALAESLPGGERLHAVSGDLASPRLGLDDETLTSLRGRIDHFFHLAAIYDLRADAESQRIANIEGTRNAVECASALQAGRFHLMSSIAAAGLYPGVFREDMFAEAEDLDHPYFRTKHESEAVVRNDCPVPWRIYRPGFAVGDSQTGEMDKIDGPYYFFKLIQRARDNLPRWAPLVGLEGGRFNLVPVDYIVAATDYIAHVGGEDGGTFHLVDREPLRFGELLNVFARAARAPEMTVRINARVFEVIPPALMRMVGGLQPVQQLTGQLLDDLGIPASVFQFINWPTRYDARETERVLAGSGIECPPIESYAWRLWDHWERHLDPELFIDRSIESRVGDKVVVITGGSSGIGKATALRLARAGARVVIVARTEEPLIETQREIEAAGGRCAYYTGDLTDLEAIDDLARRILEGQGQVDVLVNNAGHSIRRSIEHSYDRFHDFERLMQLNYFGCLRLTLALLPSMTERGEGQVVNISSIGVLSNAPRFSAYVASKAALEAFSRCAGAEFAHQGVHFTTINMPLVRTKMIAPTKLYEHVPTLAPEEAAELVAKAIIERPERLVTRLGKTAQVVHAVAPRAMQGLMNSAFQMFPDSSAATGQNEGDERKPSREQMALANLLRGIHW